MSTNNISSALFKDSKYRGLMLSIVSLFALTLIVSLITSYYTNKADLAIEELDLVSQQIIIEKQIAEEILNTDMYLQDYLSQNNSATDTIRLENAPPEVLNLLNQLEHRTKVFSQMTSALKNGGSTTLDNGRVIEIDGIQTEYLTNYVQNIENYWLPLQGLVENFLKESKSGQLSKQQSEYMVDYIRLYDEKLHFELVNLQVGINHFISVQSRAILVTQTVGALIALGLLFVIIFGAFKRLVNNDRLLELARRETTDIMTTVNTGLFLLDKELTIGSQYSNVLENIMGTNRLAGENLTTVLRNRISDKDLETARQFVQQLYNPRVKENLVNDLNPLNKILFRDEKHSKNRYLDFKFSRVYENREIARILVNINDVSEAVLLEQRLEKERAQNDLQIEMLTTILNVQPRIIQEFIDNTMNHINKINNILKNPGSSQFELQAKLKSIYREMHSLKGEASALKLHNFVKIATEAEDKMHDLQNQPQLSGNDFLPLTVHLDELLTLATTISTLGERISQASEQNKHQSPVGLTPETESNHLVSKERELKSYYQEFVQDIAQRQEKNVQINIDAHQFAHIPNEYEQIVKEISIQLLRNAIVHGIESPQERIASGKDDKGTVKMEIKRDAEQLTLIIEDDGKGIDYPAIRHKLVEQGKYSSEQVITLDDKQLLSMLFSSGFSTRNSVDEDGGRGIGLDIIKERVQEHKGKLNVLSVAEQGTQFIVTLPL